MSRRPCADALHYLSTDGSQGAFEGPVAVARRVQVRNHVLEQRLGVGRHLQRVCALRRPRLNGDDAAALCTASATRSNERGRYVKRTATKWLRWKR